MVATAISHSGSTDFTVSDRHCTAKRGVKLTNQGLLAQLLSFGEFLLLLEQSQSLVDQRQNIHGHRLGLLLHFHGGIKLLDSLLELALVEQQLTVVVVDIRHLVKVLDTPSEGGHGGRYRAHLVLGNTELNVRKDEGGIEVDGLLVVLGSLLELAVDKVQLSAVVVDIRVLVILLNGLLEIVSSLSTLAYIKWLVSSCTAFG